MQWLILGVGALAISYALYQIGVALHVVLLSHIQLVLVVVTTVFLFFPDYVLVILEQLTGLILGSWLGLYLSRAILILLTSILRTGLSTVRNHLLHVYHVIAISMNIAEIAGLLLAYQRRHHTLWKVVRLRYLVLHIVLRRVLLLTEVSIKILLSGIIASPAASPGRWSLQTFTQLTDLRNRTEIFSSAFARYVLLRLLLLHILLLLRLRLAELALLYYVLLGWVPSCPHQQCLVRGLQVVVYVICCT